MNTNTNTNTIIINGKTMYITKKFVGSLEPYYRIMRDVEILKFDLYSIFDEPNGLKELEYNKLYY